MIHLRSKRKWTEEEIYRAAIDMHMRCWMQGEIEIGEWIMYAWTDEMIVDYVESRHNEVEAYNLKWHIEEAAKIIKEYA